MGERRGMKALELWCKRVTDGYDEVKVENMTTSWRDGLAFCAIIHHFRPDLIDFDSLNKEDIYQNNELAFRTAELHLGIPALLDAEDMVECSMPDRLSILTYLSQFYQTFVGSRQSNSPNRTPSVGKRSASPSSVRSPASQTPPTKMAMLGPSRREPCAKCQLPVFIAERLLVGGRTLYHRTCFRCARCQHQLSIANCYETEDGQYCCETCPDEVDQEKDNTDNANDTHSISLEKNDTYSTDFESVLESEKSYSTPDSVRAQDVVSSKARTDFMIGQLEWREEEVTKPYPDISTTNSDNEDKKELGSAQSVEVSDCSHVNSEGNVETPPVSDNSNSVEVSTYFSTKTNSQPGEDTQKVVEQVPSINSFKNRDSFNQPLTANDSTEDCLDDQNKLITQCTKESDTSFVKMRMKMFDNTLSNNSPKVSSTIDFSKTSRLSKSRLYTDVKVSGQEKVSQQSDFATDTDLSSIKMNSQELPDESEKELKNDAFIDEINDEKLLDKMESETNSLLSKSKLYTDVKVSGQEKMSQQSDFATDTDLSSIKMNSQELPDESEKELKNDAFIDEINDEKLLDTMESETNTLLSKSKLYTDVKVSGQEKMSQQSDFATDTDLSSIKMNSQELPDKSEKELKNDAFIDEIKDEKLLDKMESETNSDSLIVETKDIGSEKESVCDQSAMAVDNEEVAEDKITSEVPDSVEPNSHPVTMECEEKVKQIFDSSNHDANDKMDSTSPDRVSESVQDKSSLEDEQKSLTIVSSGTHIAETNSIEYQTKSQDKTIEEYPIDLNPFGDEDGEEETAAVSLKPTVPTIQTSTNPFGSSDEEDEPPPLPKAPPPGKPPRPPLPQIRQSLTLSLRDAKISPASRHYLTLDSRKAVDLPSTSLNPFWSDGEEPSSDEEAQPKLTPVPLPRAHKNMSTQEPSPLPRLNRSSGQFGSCTSLSSTGSSANSTIRHKKKPAPPPPLPPAWTHPGLSTPPDGLTPTNSVTSSPRAAPRHRKARPAPPPPDSLSAEVECEREKNEKDEENRTRQTKRLIKPTEEQAKAMIAPNKSTFGQWKRKKGPAPPRPVPPQRRQIKVMPMKEVKRLLDDIEVQQLELERQGVCLEKTIRAKFEPASGIDDGGVTPDMEDLILQLFEIVNEKNELFRRQAELMYLRRQHRLEEEHADLEYEIRCLLVRPEHTKTDSDKAYEEELIQRLVDVVERRNEIVNSLEMDRRREVEEDLSIQHHMASFAAKGKADISDKDEVDGGSTTSHSKKKTLKLLKKKVKKSKEKLSKKSEKTAIDSDKDIDESDSAKSAKEKKPKKKWF